MLFSNENSNRITSENSTMTPRSARANTPRLPGTPCSINRMTAQNKLSQMQDELEGQEEEKEKTFLALTAIFQQ